ncbi:uncharacterized protein [Clytia hemisphaerica]|uniref:uncharacterized protein n=1 Tax=Clytia hemisphaerica TaxID=252671 RepID=UPI0034D6B39D
MPESIFYSSFVGELLRIARSTLLFEDLKVKAKVFIERMRRQGADNAKLDCSLHYLAFAVTTVHLENGSLDIQMLKLLIITKFQPNEGGPPKKKFYKPKDTWTANFYCLAEMGATHTPSSAENQTFTDAGLGKKSIQLNNKASHLDLVLMLEEEYPKLATTNGRFMLHRAEGGGSGKRRLIRIATGPCGYSVPYLKDSCNIGTATIYVVPIQESLDMTKIVTRSYCSPTVECIFCGDFVELLLLQEHTKICSKNPGNEQKENGQNDKETSQSSTSTRTSSFVNTHTRNDAPVTSQSSTSTSTRTSSFVNTHTRNDAPVAMPLQPRISTGTQPSSEIIDITSTFLMAADTDDAITSGLADSVSKYNAMKATVKEWEKCDICYRRLSHGDLCVEL